MSSSPVPNYKLLFCDRQNLHRSAQFSKSSGVGIGRFARYPIRLMIPICPSLLGNIGHILSRYFFEVLVKGDAPLGHRPYYLFSNDDEVISLWVVRWNRRGEIGRL